MRMKEAKLLRILCNCLSVCKFYCCSFFQRK